MHVHHYFTGLGSQLGFLGFTKHYSITGFFPVLIQSICSKKSTCLSQGTLPHEKQICQRPPPRINIETSCLFDNQTSIKDIK